MNTKITHILALTLGFIPFIYGCAPSAPSATQAQATSITVSATLPSKTKASTSDGLSIRETERVATVFAIQSATATFLPTHTPRQTPTPEPTSTPRPISKDDVLISYSRYAGDGTDEITSCLNAYYSYRFALYRDGHLIIFDKTRYLETRISQTEIDKLLSEIDATGLASVIGNGDQYMQNAPAPSFVGGWGSSIVVIEKRIDIIDALSNYLIEPVTKTIDIIENYRPQSLKPYTPESITLWVFSEQGLPAESFVPTPQLQFWNGLLTKSNLIIW